MGVIQFPPNPSPGEQYSVPNGPKYEWDGDKWVCLGGSGGGGGGGGGLNPIPTDTVLGNVSGAEQIPNPLTGAQVTALLSVFDATDNGLVPAPGAADPGTNVLLSSGAWGDVTSGMGTFPTVQPGLVPAAGTAPANAALQADGTWRSARITFSSFTVPGIYTYTPPPGLVYAIIEMRGGGGAGEVARLGAIMYAGGGGGQGLYARLIRTAAQIGASAQIIVGGGGISPDASGAGGTIGGEATYFATTQVQGGRSAGVALYAGGDGGTTYSNILSTDFVIPGQAGGYGAFASPNNPPGETSYAWGGVGGGNNRAAVVSPYGGISHSGLPGTLGAGGNGSVSNRDTATAGTWLPAGNGGDGYVYITEFSEV